VQHQSLGTSSETVSRVQHSRAEVYLSNYGWVPVDPADVPKVVLEEPPGDRPLEDEMVKKARARLFGSWNWMAYDFAHDVVLPGSLGAALGFLMFPQAETAYGRLDCLDPDSFKCEITPKEAAPRTGDENERHGNAIVLVVEVQRHACTIHHFGPPGVDRRGGAIFVVPVPPLVGGRLRVALR
jgi:hypothetical protein